MGARSTWEWLAAFFVFCVARAAVSVRQRVLCGRNRHLRTGSYMLIEARAVEVSLHEATFINVRRWKGVEAQYMSRK